MEGATKRKPKKERTLAQQAAFEKARLMNAMHEGSPRERHERKVYDALHHIQGWGFSTSILTARACRTKSTSFLSRMKKLGLIRYEDVLGRNYILLTRKGLNFLRNVTGCEDSVAWQRANMRKVNTVSLFAFEHNDYMQSLIANRQATCWDPHVWLSERQLRIRLAQRTEEGAKVPDACFATAIETVFYEIERSKKSKKEIEIMFLNLVRLIESKPKHRVEIHFLKDIKKSYAEIYARWLSSGEWQLYTAGADGIYSPSMMVKLTVSMRDALERFRFVEVHTEHVKT